MIHNLVTPWRLKWYPRVILIAFSLGFLISFIHGNHAETFTGRLGADYPGFYGAGRIVAQADSRELYNLERQAKAQEGLFPGESGFLVFYYPPYTALAYAPLSLLPYRWSYAVHTLLMIGLLLLTLRCIRSHNALIQRHFTAAFVAALMFYPILRSVIGGQNTALTLVLVALSWHTASVNRDYVAGMLLGLLLFKPHFALPLIALFLLAGRWRVGIGSGIVAIALYAMGALMLGADWPVIWIGKALALSQVVAGFDSQNLVSWLGFFEAFLGAAKPLALIIGWSLSLFTALLLAWLWRPIRNQHDFSSRMRLACVGILLIPPHVMYYDTGLVWLSYAILSDNTIKQHPIWLLAVWFLGFTQPLSAVVGFSPLFFLVLASLVFHLRSSARPHLEARLL